MAISFSFSRCAVLLSIVLYFADNGSLLSENRATIDSVKLDKVRNGLVRGDLTFTEWGEILDNPCTAEMCLPEMVQLLREAEFHDPSTVWIVLGSIQRIGPRASAASIPIAEILISGRPDNRLAVLCTLAKIGPLARTAVPSIKLFIERKTPVSVADEMEIYHAYATLVAIEGPKSKGVKCLIDALEGTSVDDQSCALSALLNLEGDRRVVPFLEHVAKLSQHENTDPDIRELCLNVMFRIRSCLSIKHGFETHAGLKRGCRS